MKIPSKYAIYHSFVRRHTKFGLDIFGIDFVIVLGAEKKENCAVAHHTHMNNSHTKFGWDSSNGLGVDSMTVRQT